MYEDEILLEHIELPETFALEIHVTCMGDELVFVKCIDKDSGSESAIHGYCSEYASKIGVIIDTIITNIKATIGENANEHSIDSISRMR